MKTEVDPDARAGRFSRRFSYYDEPAVIQHLEAVATESATSASTLVRAAVRQLLDRLDPPVPRVR